MITTQLYAEARAFLSFIVTSEASRVRDTYSAYYTYSAGAPETWQEVFAAFVKLARGETNVYLVSDAGNEHTIYRSPSVNAAFRFWHDSLHFELLADFSTEDELKVAKRHLEIFRKRCSEFPHVSLEVMTLAYALLEAETKGQALAFATAGKFIQNQEEFDLGYAIGRMQSWL